MKKLLLVTLISLISLFTFSQIINIPLDYPTIQEGIDAASIGDTVLVDTGTYVENINFNGKNITVASQYLTTLDTSYISQTIIDGDSIGTVVTFENGESTTARLSGFNITNGLGGGSHPYYFAGGIQCDGSSPTIDNVHVTKNVGRSILIARSANPVIKNSKIFANYGSGISCNYESSPSLTDLLIANNLGYGIYCGSDSNPTIGNTIISGNTTNSGGGLNCYNSSPTLENVSIINNHANSGGGILCYDYSNPSLSNVRIVGNTASSTGGGIACVYGASPNFSSSNLCSIHSNDAPVGKDLYTESSMLVVVDTFSILYPTDYYAEPRNIINFTINHGFIEQVDSNLYISPDGSNTNNGLNEEEPMKTIDYALSKLMADNQHHNNIYLLNGVYSPSSNGETFPLYLLDYVNLIGESVNEVVLDAEEQSNVLVIENNTKNEISNFIVTNGNYENSYPGYYSGGVTCSGTTYPILTNIKIIDNPSGGLSCLNSSPILKNVVIANNFAGSGAGIYCYYGSPKLINVTIAGNDVYGDGSGIYCGFDSNPTLINTILWNNTYDEIYFWGSWQSNSVTISYSDIKGGEDAIIHNDNGTVNWMDGNIDQDPIFVGSGDYPYQINDYSPCIDAGTPDTTELNLPEYDLAGDIRIFNERIDIGAYEWNSLGANEFNILHPFQIENYPNPFTTSTTLSYELQNPEKVSLSIYNQMGKQVYQTQENQQQGKQQLQWNAEGNADGIYYYRLQVGDEVAKGKMVKVR